MTNRAWLVVDMTYDFVANDGALTCGARGQAIVDPLLTSLNEARSQGDLIVFACDAHEPDDAEFRLWPQHCVKGTRGASLFGPLADFYDRYRSDSVVFLPKTRYDAFYETRLEEWLKANAIAEVVIAGVCTSICCYATASGAYYRGYDVFIDPNLMADLTEDNHTFAIDHMKNVLKAQLKG